VEFSSDEWASGSVELARFNNLADARERGLVLASKGLSYLIQRCGDEWVVRVSCEDRGAACEELGFYEDQLRMAAQEVGCRVEEAPRWAHQGRWTLHFVAWLFVLFAILQAELGESWRNSGLLSAELVVRGGQWWRVFTALSLHADVPHVIANISAGLLFAGLMIPSFGQGLTWILILMSGAVGNALNAWIYFPGDHQSIGASTAVFGALGLLVGDSCGDILMRRSGRSVWRWILPLGAGLALFAYLGTGAPGERIDVMAHLWGFTVGLPLGGAAAAMHVAERMRQAGQVACGLLTAALLGGAWLMAFRM
jgi:membrane associated rhomboid family serine protease